MNNYISFLDNPTYGKNETIDLSKQKQGPKITGNFYIHVFFIIQKHHESTPRCFYAIALAIALAIIQI